MTNTPIHTNDRSASFVEKSARMFYFSIPLYLAVPILIGIVSQYGVASVHWSAFGLGAMGWFIAFLLRGPLGLLVKRWPKDSAALFIGLSSGPLEEGVRFILLLLTGTSFSWALSIGQGWAAIEVLFVIINGLVLVHVLKRNDEQSLQIKEMLETQKSFNISPFWGVGERVFASLFHIGATLLIAKIPMLVLVLLFVHSLFNLTVVWLSRKSMVLAQLFAAVMGMGLLVLGIMVFHCFCL